MKLFSKHKADIIEDLKNFSKVLEQLKLAENKWWEFAREIESKTIEDYSQFISNDFNSYVQKFKEELEILRESEKIKEELKLVESEQHIKKFLEDLNQLESILTYQQRAFKSHLNSNKKPSQNEFQSLLNFLKQDHENESKASQLMNNLISQLEIEDGAITDDTFDKQVIKCAQIIDKDKIKDNDFLNLFEEAVRRRNFGIQDNKGWTPLHRVCRTGHKDLALELINIYPDALKIQDEDDRTPLYMACGNGNKDLVLELIKIYPEAVKIPNNFGCTPLGLACFKGYEDLALELSNIYPEAIKIQDKGGDTPLHYVCRTGNEDLALELINIYPEAVKIQNDNYYTPLSLALEQGHLSLTLKLIKIYPKAVKIQNINGWTLLHKACEYGHKDLALEMIKIYPEAIKIQLKYSNTTPLTLAIEINLKEVIKYIINNDLEINEVDRVKFDDFRKKNQFYTDKIKGILHSSK